MPKTRLRQIYESIINHQKKCEYSEKCACHRDDSYTCMQAIDKSYCGTYNQHIGGEQSE